LSVKSRDILKSEKFIDFWGDIIQFKKDEDGKTAYSNTSGGSRRIATVGGNITGFHAHVIVVDDALNPKGARSEVELKNANKWIDDTLSTRKVDKRVTLTIHIQQRLAEDDTTGHLLEKNDNIYHICLPGEITDLDNVNPPELKDNYVNDLLDINRLDKYILRNTRIELGDSGYGNQVLQYPAAAEGNIFKREYWTKFYSELPKIKKIQIVQSWDTALKKEQMNDFWCCTTWWEFEHGYYLYDFLMEKMTAVEGKEEIILQNSKHRPHFVLIEDSSASSVIIQQLEVETKIPILPISVHRDKIVRAKDSTPTIQAGNVYLPNNKPWTANLMKRLAIFPDGKHDDDVDSITQFLNWVRTRPQIPTQIISVKNRLREPTISRF